MNKFVKFCPNVWVAECDQEYNKGDIIFLETKHGKEVECQVYNLLSNKNGLFYYSIVRIEEQNFAERRAERYRNASSNHSAKSTLYLKNAQEGSEFLSLGEPIKVGHHSEKRHRALLDRNHRRMEKCIEFSNKAEEAAHKAEYWDKKAAVINLSLPESIEFYRYKLEAATARHKGLKDGSIKREHSYSLQYATKEVKEMKKNLELAEILWGEKNSL